jgi:hypothetical protein
MQRAGRGPPLLYIYIYIYTHAHTHVTHIRRFHSIDFGLIPANRLRIAVFFSIPNRLNIGSLDSSVGIATGYRLDDRGVGVRVPVGSRIFSTSSRLAMRFTQPPIQWVPGVISPGVKRPGREADYSPPASAEVKKMWIYTSTPPYAFMA